MYICFLLIAVVTRFFGRKFADDLITVKQVSMLKAMGIQYQIFSETESLFPGKGNKDEKAFLLEFGISSDLETEAKCSRDKLKTLLVDLKLKLMHYFPLKGQVMSLKKKSDSTENQDEIETSLEALKESRAELNKILNNIFECVVTKTVSRHKSSTMSPNHVNCTIYSYIYHSSIKKLDKKLIIILEDIFFSLSKSHQYCKLTYVDVRLPTCQHLLYSVKIVKDNISFQTSRYFQCKRMKKRCKHFLNSNILQFFGV